MKTKEEIEKLAQTIHYDMFQQGLDVNGCFNQHQGYIKGYTQCQEDNKNKKYTEEDIQRVLDSFTNDAPGFYIKTNFIEKLKDNEK